MLYKSLVPSLLAFCFLFAFGNSAISKEYFARIGESATVIKEISSSAEQVLKEEAAYIPNFHYSKRTICGNADQTISTSFCEYTDFSMTPVIEIQRLNLEKGEFEGISESATILSGIYKIIFNSKDYIVVEGDVDYGMGGITFTDVSSEMLILFGGDPSIIQTNTEKLLISMLPEGWNYSGSQIA